jgi:hypothetical protein
MDDRYGDVTTLVCNICGRHWLRYHYELESFSGSGRWYLGPVTAEQAVAMTAGQAKETIERMDWRFFGGSYFDGHTGRSNGETTL